MIYQVERIIDFSSSQDNCRLSNICILESFQTALGREWIYFTELSSLSLEKIVSSFNDKQCSFTLVLSQFPHVSDNSFLLPIKFPSSNLKLNHRNLSVYGRSHSFEWWSRGIQLEPALTSWKTRSGYPKPLYIAANPRSKLSLKSFPRSS